MAYAESKTKTHTFRKLEELNLLDDFLFQEMVISPEVGEEFCRILLQVILGREIRQVKITPQRSIPGRDTDNVEMARLLRRPAKFATTILNCFAMVVAAWGPSGCLYRGCVPGRNNGRGGSAGCRDCAGYL